MTQASDTVPKQHCAGTRRDGEPCESRVLCDGTHCYVHAPDRADERAEARRRGGHGRSNAARLRGLLPPRLVPVFNLLEGALDEVHRGDLDPRIAQAMASLARAMTTVLSAGELEARVRELEAAGVFAPSQPSRYLA